MRFLKYSIFLLVNALFIVLISSCETFHPDNEIPSYIHIDSIGFISNSSLEGSSSHKITDAWVYLNDQQIGVYELPVTFPVLLSGSNKLRIYGGIKMNGISATRVSYPFFEPFESQIDLKITKVDTVKPSVNYYSAAAFPLIENFEDAIIKIERLGSSDTTLVQVSDPDIVFEGNYCGGIFLDESRPLFRASSLYTLPLDLPKGKPVFLELNYKNNQRFNIGLIAKDPISITEDIIMTLTPSTSWNKIYINLTETVNKYPNAYSYYLLITAFKETDIAKPAIYIDNVKVVR